ncbi:MAG: hypothetical protein FWH14_07495 [Oscillospiraceae bacterium]|nr:hypothetical protein [Oscillospiraceae bacterium]
MKLQIPVTVHCTLSTVNCPSLPLGEVSCVSMTERACRDDRPRSSGG